MPDPVADSLVGQPRPALVDAHAVYMTGEDNLRLTAFNSLAGVELALEGRFVTVEGRVIPIVERSVPTSDRVATVTLHSLGEGFLANLMVRAGVGTPVRGQTFVIVEIVRGRLGAVQPLGCLLQGYVTSSQRLAWPGSPIDSSGTGEGVVSVFTGTNPAANVEISETVPAGAVWRVHQFFATLTTDANVANRLVTLVMDDGATMFFNIEASAPQTATLLRNYAGAAWGVGPDLVGPTYRLPGPFPITLKAGFRIRTQTVNRQVGDNWNAPILMLEELLAG